MKAEKRPKKTWGLAIKGGGLGDTDLGLHLGSLLGVHGQDVLVVADGVLTILILGTHVPLQSLQDTMGLRRQKEKIN